MLFNGFVRNHIHHFILPQRAKKSGISIRAFLFHGHHRYPSYLLSHVFYFCDFLFTWGTTPGKGGGLEKHWNWLPGNKPDTFHIHIIFPESTNAPGNFCVPFGPLSHNRDQKTSLAYYLCLIYNWPYHSFDWSKQGVNSFRYLWEKCIHRSWQSYYPLERRVERYCD